MIDAIATLQSLTIPMGGFPNIHLGPQADVPPQVAAYYSPDKVVAIQLFEQNSQEFLYIAMVVPSLGLPYVAVGGMEPIGLTVSEALRWYIRGGFSNNPTETAILGAFSIDGNSAPRGTIGYDVVTVTTSGINIETVVQIGSTLTFKNGRAYKVTFNRQTSCSTADGEAIYILRRNSLTGAQLYESAFPMSHNAGVNVTCMDSIYLMNNSGADITDHLDLTLQVFGGGGGATLAEVGETVAPFRRRTMHYEDIGSANMFAQAHQI